MGKSSEKGKDSLLKILKHPENIGLLVTNYYLTLKWTQFQFYRESIHSKVTPLHKGTTWLLTTSGS